MDQWPTKLPRIMSIDQRLKLELTDTQIGYIRFALRKVEDNLCGAGASFVHVEIGQLLAEINEQVTEQVCRENNVPPPSPRIPYD